MANLSDTERLNLKKLVNDLEGWIIQQVFVK